MVDLPIVMLVYQRVELNQQTPDRLSAEGRHGSPVIRIEEAHDPGDDPRNPDRPNSPTAVGAAEAIPLMGLHGMQQASMGLFDRL